MTNPDRHPVPNDTARDDDEWLDSLLMRDAAATSYLEDGGFTASVMAKLPARPARSLQRWIVPAMGGLGFLVGIGLLSGGEILSLNVASLASFESFSLHKLLLVAIPLGIFYWFGVSTALHER